MLFQQMLKKFSRGVAIKMLDLAATQAFFVKMPVAIAMAPHILEEGEFAFGIGEFSYVAFFAER